MRKSIAILFFLVAQIVILGHDIVLHHHHNKVSLEELHLSNTGKKEHPNESLLEFAFSGFVHGGEYVSSASSDENTIVISKEDIKSVKVKPIEFSIPLEYIIVYQKNTFPPDRHIVYNPPLNGAFSLRGPPFFIV